MAGTNRTQIVPAGKHRFTCEGLQICDTRSGAILDIRVQLSLSFGLPLGMHCTLLLRAPRNVPAEDSGADGPVTGNQFQELVLQRVKVTRLNIGASSTQFNVIRHLGFNWTDMGQGKGDALIQKFRKDLGRPLAR